tara:strand:+ start:21 stop:236 length:216 start_codon:yes stop_codon:yes gene_type:complete
MLQSNDIKIGQQFIARSNAKIKRVETVSDILETRSTITGELKGIKYLATHEFMGQTITDSHCAVTIQRGAI